MSLSMVLQCAGQLSAAHPPRVTLTWHHSASPPLPALVVHLLPAAGGMEMVEFCLDNLFDRDSPAAVAAMHSRGVALDNLSNTFKIPVSEAATLRLLC